eukprot:c27366_g1_i9 orf=448-1539(-)
MDYGGEELKKRKMIDDINGSLSMLSKDDLKMLLDPLSKEQLVALLVNAGSQFPAIADDIRDVASKDPAHRKLFVRGLAWETSSQALRDAFQEYGEIEEGAVIMDRATGKSRGYGFITFKHMDSAQRALKEPSKMIDGRISVCNLASAGTITSSTGADQAQRKLFIGGLSYDTSTETLIDIFSQYGEIEEGSVAYDKNTNKSRGFAFVTFKSLEATRKALEDPNKNIEGRHVIVKLAAEGQKDKGASQVLSAQSMQVVSPVQPGYAVNPNMTNYPRAQVPTGAATPIGFSAYPPNLAAAYAAQPQYATLPGAQYSAVASGAQYGSAQYGQYGGSFANPQAMQPGLHASATPAVGVLPSYYSGSS